MLKRKAAALCILFCLFSTLLVFGQTDRGVAVKSTGEKRLALVIGNGAYQHTSPLPNPQNDAVDMKAALESLGFEVIYGVNQNSRQMKALIRQFGDKLFENKGVGLFYYAGHGVASGGENYLVPVDADIPAEDEIQDATVSLSFLLGKMSTAGNSLNLVILDACRNNPFARNWRTVRDASSNGGLATINRAPSGTLIAYATAPGSVASDGEDKNGLYTQELLAQMRKPGLPIEEVFKNVRSEVRRKSKNLQTPWESSSIEGAFYFKRVQTAQAVTPGKDEALKTDAVTEKGAAAVEREAWSYIKDSSDPQDFRSFLSDFPNGANAGNAKIRLEQSVWDSVKNSGDKGKLQGYLNEFPTGVNAPLARIRIRQLDAASTGAAPNNSNSTSGAIAAGTVITNSLGMKFAYSPVGTFQMGSTNGESDEKPVRTVSIGRGFYMGRTEVTQGQWEQVMGTTLRQQRDKHDPSLKLYGEGADYPMYYVSWEEAKEYIRRLNARNDGYIYSLPTEAEWEYAARAGTTGDYAGDLDSMAWFGNNSGNSYLDADAIWKTDQSNYGKRILANGSATHPVGQKQPNAFGLYDMHGNVWEWCEDIYNDKGYAGSPTDGSANVSVGDSSKRVLRGGSWGTYADVARSASRLWDAPSGRGSGSGFRVLARLR